MTTTLILALALSLLAGTILAWLWLRDVARALCVAEHGPQTTWADQPDGSIRCITRRGAIASTHASAQVAHRAQP